MFSLPKSVDITEFNALAHLHDLTVYSSNFKSCVISKVTSVNETSDESLSYLINIDALSSTVDQCQGLILISEKLRGHDALKNIGCKVLYLDDPKYFFAALVESLYKSDYQEEKSLITFDASSIHPSAQISRHAIIEEGVKVGENSLISAGVYLSSGTSIGNNVNIKPNTVIGGSGFGFAVRKGYPPLKIPHFGGVTICDNVDIGSCNTIDRGTFGNTVLSDYVKTDNGVHIGHNSHIGERTIITAHVEISGGVRIGQDSWIAPNVSIKEKVKIGQNVLVGIGSVVIRNVENDLIVAGVPARPIRNRL